MIQRFHGSLWGLAVGDAYGVPFEWNAPFSSEPHLYRDNHYIIHTPISPPEQMVQKLDEFGNVKTDIGQWSDDLALALCLAESLVTCGEHNPRNQRKKYRDWLVEGYMTATGVAYGSGRTMRTAVEAFDKEPFAYFTGEIEGGKIGNGSVMRLAPIPMFYVNDKRMAVEIAIDSSRVTHSDPVCLDVCAIFAEMLWKALNGYAKEDILARSQFLIAQFENEGHEFVSSDIGIKLAHRNWNKVILEDEIDMLSNVKVEASGYAPKSMEAGVWCFAVTDNFVDGMKLAISLGGDTDSTGSIYGQLAGAHYGLDAIPRSWRDCLMKGRLVTEFAQKLYNNRYQPNRQ